MLKTFMSRAGICLALALALPLCAEEPFEFWPGAQYDPHIPTVQQVLGFEDGDQITSSSDILRYLDALAAASTSLRVSPYAETWEKRKLVYAAVGSEANLKRLPEIRAAMRKQSDPRKTSEAKARALIAGLPAVIWLGYGVHGNETSPSDAALMTAYHLLAARGDKMVDDILANVVVLIDPWRPPI